MNHRRFALVGLLLLFCLSPATQAAAPMKEWNFLVFLNGVNNLDSFGKMNINQMEEVGSNDQLNILVQWGSMGRKSVDRLYVQKDNDTRKVTSPVVQTLGAADMGDWRQLVDFARWAQTNYPAKHTFIAVWNHGSGWHWTQSIGAKDISYDDRTGSVITTEQLGKAMRQIASDMGRKVDIYASDACLMGMVEVADEMADAVDVYVGSQDLEPGQGWPYSTFLREWMARPDLAPADVGRLLSRKYLESYNGGIYGNSSVTMSVFDLSKIGAYRQAVSALASELSAQSPAVLGALKTALPATKSFFMSDYKDLIDFLNQGKVDAIAPVSAAALRAAHADFVIANDQNQDAKTFGLSLWLPEDAGEFQSYWPRYQGLSFHQSTGWGRLVQTILAR